MISYIIPLHNHLDKTISLLKSLEVNPSDEIIFIDDASTDGTQEWLRNITDSQIKIIHNKRNLGYAKSNNLGAKMAEGEFLCFLNNDLILSPGWLDPLISCLQDDHLYAGIVGNIQLKVSDGLIDHAGVHLTNAGQFEHIKVIDPKIKNFQKVFAVTGACFVIRNILFKEINGFDELYINGCEDIDLCIKVRERNLNIYLATNSVIRHHVGASRGADNLQNEVNSRLLFNSRRQEIKAELSRLWSQYLSKNIPVDDALLNKHLTAAYLSTPQITANLVAESLLLRQEARWGKVLGCYPQLPKLHPPVKPFIKLDQLNILGIKVKKDGGFYLTQAKALIILNNINSICNFYICGKQTPGKVLTPITLAIQVNDIQFKECVLEPNKNFNFGIVDPILFREHKNTITISLKISSQSEKDLINNNIELFETIQISHFVIDDKIILTL